MFNYLSKIENLPELGHEFAHEVKYEDGNGAASTAVTVLLVMGCLSGRRTCRSRRFRRRPPIRK